MSMPDKWEYPWFAAWDLAFHCVALAHVDPAFAKYQLILLCREWFQHPNGAMAAYEWDFGDVNPPVQAWAALEVFVIDGGRDFDFLSQVFDKLLVNFTWWVNLQDATGSNLFEGGFLGLGQHRAAGSLPPTGRRHARSRPTRPAGWRPTRSRWEPSPSSCSRSGRPAADLVLKFLEHLAAIRTAIAARGCGTTPTGCSTTGWSPRTGRGAGGGPVHGGHHPDAGRRGRRRGDARPGAAVRQELPGFLVREGLHDREKLAEAGLLRGRPGQRGLLLGVVRTDRLERMFEKLFDEAEFLSPHGLRAMSAYHREHPYELEVGGMRAGDRLRARRIDHRDVRRQLQLAWTGVVPAQPHGHQRARALRPVLRRRLHGRVPDRIGAAAAAAR